jgi:hypothetical protein
MTNMTAQNWIYAAWFQDTQAEPDDEDREWVAVMAISADSAEKAKEWGDHLARKRSARYGEDIFLCSDVHLPTDARYGNNTNWNFVPRISYGEETDDEYMGWQA